MTDQPTSKRCGVCAMSLPLAMFSPSKNGKYGRAWECKDCMNVRVKARRDLIRSTIGEDAWLASQREIVARKTGGEGDRRYNRAYRAAVAEMVDLHRAEFERLLAWHRAAVDASADDAQPAS